MTFDTFELSRNPKMGKALEICREVAAGKRWCAFLAGQVGIGKTHLAHAVVHVVPAAHMWKAPWLLAWLRSLLSSGIQAGWGADEVDEIIRRYCSPIFLLVVDDLGTENRTEWAQEQLYRILDGRYENHAPTILTTNAPLSEIDQRILSRYREGLVICEGKDQR